MRRLPAVPVALAVFAVLGCQSSTDPGGSALRPGAPRGDAVAKTAQATGSGHFTYLGELRTFAFNAQGYADGSATGEMQLDNRAQGLVTHGTVLCVGEIGNSAYVGVQLTSSSNPSVVGQLGIFQVVDNGEGAKALPDLMSLVYYGYPQSTVTAWCAGAFPNAFPLNAIDGGNIQVH